MNYSELVEYLNRSWSRGPDGGTVDSFPFDEVLGFLDERGNPHDGLHVVHVTGSKGKGSVVALASALLRVHG